MLGKHQLATMICTLGGVPLGAWLGSLGDNLEPPSNRPVARVEMTEPSTRKVAEKHPRPTLGRVLKANGREQFRLIARFLPEASEDEIQALLVIPKSERDSWRLLLARWCELAPHACLAWVREDKALGDLEPWCFYAWAHVDVMAALAEAEQEPFRYLWEVIDALANHDLQEALALSERHPENSYLRNQTLAAWSKKDPAAAMAYAQKLPEKDRLSAITALMSAIAKRDRDQALAIALDLDREKERASALASLLPEVIKENPDVAEKHILTLPQGKSRYQLLRTIAKERAERDPVAAMSWAKAQEDPSVRRVGVATAFNAMAFESVHEQAAALAEAGLEEALPNVREGNKTQRENGGGGSFTHGSDLGSALSGIVEDLAKVDPLAALRLVAKVPPKIGEMDFHPQDSLFMDLGRGWLQGEQRESFVESLSEIPSETARERMFGGAVDGASSETLAWLMAQDALFDNELVGSEEIASVARSWVKTDSLAASEWIGSLEASPGKDRAVGSLVENLMEGRQPDYEAAFAWSQAVGDPKEQARQLKYVYRRWSARDAKGAMMAVESAGLEEVISAEGGTP